MNNSQSFFRVKKKILALLPKAISTRTTFKYIFIGTIALTSMLSDISFATSKKASDSCIITLEQDNIQSFINTTKKLLKQIEIESIEDLFSKKKTTNMDSTDFTTLLCPLNQTTLKSPQTIREFFSSPDLPAEQSQQSWLASVNTIHISLQAFLNSDSLNSFRKSLLSLESRLTPTSRNNPDITAILENIKKTVQYIELIEKNKASISKTLNDSERVELLNLFQKKI